MREKGTGDLLYAGLLPTWLQKPGLSRPKQEPEAAFRSATQESGACEIKPSCAAFWSSQDLNSCFCEMLALCAVYCLTGCATTLALIFCNFKQPSKHR